MKLKHAVAPLIVLALIAASPGEQIRDWRQAALQGHLNSMALNASGNVFRMRNTLSNLKDFEVYRHEAESLARRAALAGDSEALLALTRIYAPLHDQMVSSLLAQATGADVVEELSMLLLAQKRGISPASQRGRGPMFSANEYSLEAMIADARGRADAEQVSRAEQMAANRDAEQTRRDTPTPAAFARERTTFDDERPRCDSEAFAPVAPSPASG
ncbi:MAG: hypothetical protein SGI99_04320 [Pseudomonadota bacterium]|nr:hypothetical protein [Pseudomonadota bacterium]